MQDGLSPEDLARLYDGRVRYLGLIAAACTGLAGCAIPGKPSPVPEPVAVQERRAAPPRPVPPERRSIKPIQRPAPVVRLLPARIDDRSGWALDIQDAMTLLGIEPSVANLCTVVAIVEQESGFRTDPSVPDLARLVRREIDRRRERAGIPTFVVEAALALPSSDGRSYSERLDAAGTERQLSAVFEDFARRMPLGKGFFADQNPVRTGGPMQVSVAFAQAHAAAHPYPYPRTGSIRDEVFTRRGGLYFGIAHLLHYAAPYDDPRYRFADYNAGRFASRNAAFQKAVAEAAGVALALDGDLLSLTEQATRKLAGRLNMSAEQIRRDLALGASAQFEHSRLYAA
ncbi:MAG: DUF1615 family protein, partial [Burkholderiales bacterium]